MNVVLILLAAIVFGIFSCNRPASTYESQALDSNPNDVTVEEILESKIVGSEEAKWRFKYSTFANKQSLRFFRVFDNTIIQIIGGENAFFRTTDGGQTWKTSHVELPNRARISSVLFVDPLRTAIAVVQPIENSEIDAYNSFIITTKDGGEVWSKTLTTESVLLNKLAG